jgi:4-hydroxy-2-oxoheptanedioate aldolase
LTSVPDFGDALRARWRAGSPTFGAWCSIPDPFAAEVIAQCGFDWACVDLQHGLAGLESVGAMLQAISLSGIPPLVRVPANEPWLVNRVLDLGAAGVIVPLVSSAEEAARAARACRYPPDGVRSHGPARLSTPQRTNAGYANEQVVCLVMIETEGGVSQLEEIVAVPGVDGVYVGPRDLALSHDLAPGDELDGLISQILATCRARGVPAGIHTRGGAEARRLANDGFLFCTIATDRELLARGASAELEEALGERSAPRAPDPPTLRANVSYLST